MILNDKQISDLCVDSAGEPLKNTMISPFIGVNVSTRSSMVVSEQGVFSANEKLISFGLSSFGYDARLDRQFKIISPFSPGKNPPVIDPKNFNTDMLVDFEGDFVIMPPHSFVLCRTMEYFNIPEDVVSVCLGKSTYARCGLIVNVTPLEPNWHGHVTIEISNTTPLPAKIYAGEGIAQFIFFRGERPNVTYADRNGKYQGQIAVTPPTL